MPDGSASPSASTRSTARQRPEAAGDGAGHAEHVHRQLQRLPRELALVEAQEHLPLQRRERVRHLVVDRAHHLLGRDAVGHQRRDQRAGAGADVDVELVDRAVRGEQIERPQRPDLVDAAGEAAPAQHERGPGGAAPAPRRSIHLDDIAHDAQSKRPRLRSPPPGFVASNAAWPVCSPSSPCSSSLLAPTAQAADLAATQRVLNREMARSGALFRRLRGGRQDRPGSCTRYRADVARMPASVEKLYTSATALLTTAPRAT